MDVERLTSRLAYIDAGRIVEEEPRSEVAA